LCLVIPTVVVQHPSQSFAQEEEIVAEASLEEVAVAQEEEASLEEVAAAQEAEEGSLEEVAAAHEEEEEGSVGRARREQELVAEASLAEVAAAQEGEEGSVAHPSQTAWQTRRDSGCLLRTRRGREPRPARRAPWRRSVLGRRTRLLPTPRVRAHPLRWTVRSSGRTRRRRATWVEGRRGKG